VGVGGEGGDGGPGSSAGRTMPEVQLPLEAAPRGLCGGCAMHEPPAWLCHVKATQVSLRSWQATQQSCAVPEKLGTVRPAAWGKHSPTLGTDAGQTQLLMLLLLLLAARGVAGTKASSSASSSESSSTNMGWYAAAACGAGRPQATGAIRWLAVLRTRTPRARPLSSGPAACLSANICHLLLSYRIPYKNETLGHENHLLNHSPLCGLRHRMCSGGKTGEFS
jgi:hypothetical protein